MISSSILRSREKKLGLRSVSMYMGLVLVVLVKGLDPLIALESSFLRGFFLFP
jgi:hypothetical protein